MGPPLSDSSWQRGSGGVTSWDVTSPPNNTSTIESVVAALKERPRGAELLAAGDFNAKLSEMEDDRRGEDIAAELVTEGLEDMLAHFLPLRRWWCRDERTWSMIQEVREVGYRTDYILGTDRRLFWNMFVRDPRHNSEHYMVMGCLRSDPLKEHSRYLVGRKPPLPPTTDLPRKEGWNICSPPEGRLKVSGTGREEKRLDIRGHMETR